MEKGSQAKAVKPLTKTLKFFFGVGDCGFTLMSNVETFYFNFFLTNIAQFAVGVMAIITTVVSVVDAATSWIFGGLLNTIKPRKGGRYRPWLVMLPWVVPIIFAFQFIKISDSVGLSACIIIAAGIISHFIWNIPYAANSTMVAVAGQTIEGKAQLASSRATWNNIASVLFSYVGLPFATVLGAIIGKNSQFGALAFVLGIVMVLGYYVHYRITKGYEVVEEVTTAKESKTKAGFRDMARGLFQNPHLLILMIADLAKWCVKFVVAGSAVYYWTYVAGNAGIQAIYILASSLCAVAGAYVARFLTKLLTNKTTMVYSYILMAAAMILSFFLYQQYWVVLVLMCIAQFGYGTCYACAPALYADTAVYAEWKTGKSNVGWIMGLQSFPLKIGVILKAGIIAACLGAVNFSAKIKPADATPLIKHGITASFALIPGIFLAIGAILLIFGYRLTKDKVLKYQSEIDSRG